MYNSDLASDIEKAVQDALATSDFSKLNKNITTAVNTSIAQIGTSQNRFYQQYDNQETTAEDTVTRAIPANCARLRRHSAFLAVLPRRRQTKTAETFRKTLSGCQGRTPVIPIGQLPPTAPIPPLSWYRSAAIRKGVFPASSCQYLDGLALQPA